MEAGKIEYAPDYKSKSQVRRIAAQKGLPPDSTVNSERGRLEREVVEAAKAERRAVLAYKGNSTMANWEAIYPARIAREQAVDALESFEAEQKK